MKQMRILAVGKLKEAHWKAGVEDYLSRVNRYHRLEVVEVKESPREGSAGREEEATRLLKAMDASAYNVSLSPEGTTMSTEALARKLEELMKRGSSRIDWIIGGHEGLASAVKDHSQLVLSLSKLTFPYQLSRLILAEQIYRCAKIIRGEKYHR